MSRTTLSPTTAHALWQQLKEQYPDLIILIHNRKSAACRYYTFAGDAEAAAQMLNRPARPATSRTPAYIELEVKHPLGGRVWEPEQLRRAGLQVGFEGTSEEGQLFLYHQLLPASAGARQCVVCLEAGCYDCPSMQEGDVYFDEQGRTYCAPKCLATKPPAKNN